MTRIAGTIHDLGLVGVLAASLLAGDVGISKTAFYTHFRSKDEPMLTVLQDRNEWLQESFRQMIRDHGGRSALDQLHGLFDVVEQIIEQDDFRGCIFVNAAMEFPLPHKRAHGAAAENKRAIQEIVLEIAERGGVEKPEVLARELCMIIDDAYVGRQVSGDPATIETAAGWRSA